MKLLVALTTTLTLGLSACGDAQPVASAGKPPAAAESAAAQGSRPPMSGPTCDGGPAVSRAEELDYPDYIVMNGRRYFAGGPSTVTLGAEVATVRCQLIGSGTRREYEPVDGDAAGLPAGTPIYEVAGQAPSKVLATRTPDGTEVWRPE